MLITVRRYIGGGAPAAEATGADLQTGPAAEALGSSDDLVYELTWRFSFERGLTL